MNNTQFRKLVLDASTHKTNSSISSKSTSQGRDDASALILGSRARSFVPLTPRSVSSSTNTNAFARQLAERKNDLSHSHKKPWSSAAPKGTKLPAGYIDRAKIRLEDPEGQIDSGKKGTTDLDAMSKDEVDISMPSKLRDDIMGCEVKGLDWELLEKVKRGEIDTSDVLESYQYDNGSEKESVDMKLEELEEVKVKPISREKTKKKGEMAPPALKGKKRTRDQILAELKASRKAATDPETPRLGSKFKKFSEARIGKRILRDGKGREILITIDKDGNEKRKVRVITSEDPNTGKKNRLLVPNKDLKPLGMMVPDFPKGIDIEEDLDIFDVGHDYNPLAGIESGDSSDDGKETEENKGSSNEPKETRENRDPGLLVENTILPPPSLLGARNYFQTPSSENLLVEANISSKPLTLSDPTILAALKKASKINLNAAKTDISEVMAEDLNKDISALRIKKERHRRMLQSDDRDALDLDMGFGSSRVEDDDDADEKAIRLSDWKPASGKDRKKDR